MPEQHKTNPDLQGKSVLYVEDNYKNQVLIQRILQELLPEVAFFKAFDGVEGVEQARTHRPDLILMDIGLPRMDGINTLKKLKEFAETREIPVIAITAYGMEADIKKAMDAGFDEHLIKPINVIEFSKTIQKYLS